jgi:hypothetical protein
MAREFKGKITNILPRTQGTTKKNETWKQVQFVAETEGEYPEKICFSYFTSGEKNKYVEGFIENAKIGSLVEVKFNIKTNEHEGKFYSKNEAFSVFLTKDSAEQKPTEQPTQETKTDGGDDLPF